MSQETNNNKHYKCPHCPCIFLTQVDLQKHITSFGTNNNMHEYAFKKTHGKLEHGYSDE